jgi:histidyl-tRNA synthetase
VGGDLIEPRTLRGFADVLPAVALHRRRLQRVVEDVFTSFGYDPIQTPAVEYAEILKGKGGSESDKQMFEFADQGGRPVALRFDLTVPLARFAAQHQQLLRPPIRLYQVGHAWRGERPQRGRYREFLQCDADVIGETDGTADAEIVAMFQLALHRMDIGPIRQRVNDRRILNGLLADLDLAGEQVAVLRALDKLDKIGPDGVRAELTAGGVPDSAADRLLAFAGTRGDSNEATRAAVAAMLTPGGEAERGLAELRRLFDLVGASGGDLAAVQFDPSIARGLDYYTGLVFETTLLAAPEIGSICSGGRYDDLAGLFTRTRLPGVGASIGLTRILAALDGTDQLRGTGRDREVVLITQGRDDDPAVLLRLAAAVRGTGCYDVEVYPTAAKHATQMRYADNRHARFVLTLDDPATVSVKDMASGDRAPAPLAEVAELLAKAAGAPTG